MKIIITKEQAQLIQTACELAKYDSDAEDEYEISFNKKLDGIVLLIEKAIIKENQK